MIQGVAKHYRIFETVGYLMIFVGLLIIIVGILYSKGYLESFSESNINLFNDPRYEKNRTLLYGSLFLDKLDEQIKGMTDPRIQYDTKRIDIIKYADVLL